MTETPTAQPPKKKIYCNKCKQNTNHSLIGEHPVSNYDEQAGWGQISTYRLWICAGCETGSLEVEYSNSDMMDDEGNDLSDYTYYPKRVRDDRPKKVFLKLKPKLEQIYKEAIVCFNNESYILCTAGLRALLEGVCDDKHIKGKNLRDKIDNLQPLLGSKNIVKNLHHFRFTGNQAVHKLEAPTRGSTELAIEVMDDLLNCLYELDYKASRLRASVNTRKKRKVGNKTPTLVTPSETVGT
jgi:hypothetical protein